ncbi:sensor histidine kinase [Muriicola soli]|uniref:Histidine kinase n=1 Tax=Muriicola soli TaxID=2507538 RepID=A0A411ED39_9FLAO|nr:histidine kinase [Muriicola soli]QBA65503.1 histidine kinase [Muriicola soli]
MKQSKWNISIKELVFQVILLVVVFLFYSFDRNEPGFKLHQFVFFSTYVLASTIIGYFLMPKLLYKKKYILFSISLVSIIALLIVLEELVLEPVFFPGTRRASSFAPVLYSMLGVLPVLTVLVGFKFGWDALQKQQQIEKLESIIEESELQFLRSQINPHFLFNNLNNLYSYAIQGSEKTPQIILELSGLLRYMLYECKENFVPLAKELEQLQNFIALSKLQIEDRGTVSFNVSQQVANYKIAPLILIVFIENAFKHSQAEQSDDISIKIDVSFKGDTLLFKCINNHDSGEKHESLSSGIGLTNVRKRLNLIYPKKHELSIRDNGNTYEVDLSIELTKI